MGLGGEEALPPKIQHTLDNGKNSNVDGLIQIFLSILKFVSNHNSKVRSIASLFLNTNNHNQQRYRLAFRQISCTARLALAEFLLVLLSLRRTDL